MKYKSGYKYVLAETYACKISIIGYFAKTDFIVLDTKGNLVIKQNYAWDGATMFPDLEAVKRASLTHDALCQLVRLKLLPETILEKIHNVSHANRVLGVTTHAATAAAEISIQLSDVMAEVSWSWEPDAPVFLGLDGMLTQNINSTGLFFLQIGTALSATKLLIDKQIPVFK